MISLYLSDGELLASLKFIDNRSRSSLVLIGQGIPNYGGIIAQNQIWLLENFSKIMPPPNPVIGQFWHDSSRGRMNVYTCVDEWQSIADAETECDGMFDMRREAKNIDFTIEQSVPIVTLNDPTKEYASCWLLLIPHGSSTARNPATINISVKESGDLLSSRLFPVPNPPPEGPYGEGLYGRGQYGEQLIHSTHVVQFNLNSTPALITADSPTAFLNITIPASGGELLYEARLYGLTMPAVARRAVSIISAPGSFSAGYGDGTYGIGLYGKLTP